MEQLLQEFPDDLRFVYRQFPLIGTPERPFHDKAALATQASEAAGKQGKFWEMNALLFESQSEWATLTVDDFQQWLIDQAETLGLEVEKFTADLTSDELVALAQNAWDETVKLGISSTPTILVNNQVWPSNVQLSEYNLEAVILLTLLEERQFAQCPPMMIDVTKQYVATLHTEKGDIVIELYADIAPITVNSFIFLARNGWYDGVTFHRVIPGKLAQAGDPSGTGYGTPGYAFINEISTDLNYDGSGVVGMANAGADSNGSQFFITYSAMPTLDGDYTIFGRVIQGMEVATNLTPRDPTASGDLPPGDQILNVTIDEH